MDEVEIEEELPEVFSWAFGVEGAQVTCFGSNDVERPGVYKARRRTYGHHESINLADDPDIVVEINRIARVSAKKRRRLMTVRAIG